MLHGLLAPAQRRTRLALGMLVLAAMSKNEGLTFALLVLAMIAVRQLLERAAAEGVHGRVFGAALTSALAWPAVVHARGIPSDLTSGRHLQGDAGRPLPRLGVVGTALGHLLPSTLLGLLGTLAVAALVGRGQRRRIVLLLTAQLLCAGALLAVYAFGPLEIDYWVTSSLNRTSMTLRAGGLLGAV